MHVSANMPREWCRLLSLRDPAALSGSAVKDFSPRKLGFPRIAINEKPDSLAPAENTSVRKESGLWLENRNGSRRNRIRDEIGTTHVGGNGVDRRWR